MGNECAVLTGNLFSWICRDLVKCKGDNGRLET